MRRAARISAKGKPKPINEARFTKQVIQLSRVLGWRSAHFRAAQTAHGWRTPVQGDGKGFPDLILLKGTRLVVAELKADKAPKPRPEQEDWLVAFRCLPGAEVFIWRPKDFEDIAKILR